MKAAVLHKSSSPLVLEQVADPELSPAQVLIKVKACSVCHTDLHIAAGNWALPRLLLIPGHEAMGEIVAARPRVARFKPGHRASVSWIYSTCGRCEFCASDRIRFFRKFVATGSIAAGDFAEYVRARTSSKSRRSWARHAERSGSRAFKEVQVSRALIGFSRRATEQ